MATQSLKYRLTHPSYFQSTLVDKIHPNKILFKKGTAPIFLPNALALLPQISLNLPWVLGHHYTCMLREKREKQKEPGMNSRNMNEFMEIINNALQLLAACWKVNNYVSTKASVQQTWNVWHTNPFCTKDKSLSCYLLLVLVRKHEMYF